MVGGENVHRKKRHNGVSSSVRPSWLWSEKQYRRPGIYRVAKRMLCGIAKRMPYRLTKQMLQNFLGDLMVVKISRLVVEMEKKKWN